MVERPTWSQGHRNEDDKESNPGAPEGSEGEKIVLLTYKRTSVHGEERTRRNMKIRWKDERERGEVSEGKWRSVGERGELKWRRTTNLDNPTSVFDKMICVVSEASYPCSSSSTASQANIEG